MSYVKYTHYKNWAGFAVETNSSVRASKADLHGERVFYLVAQLEAPTWGAVQNYDGVGVSAGPLHSVAVLRTGSQGSLWKMLQEVATDSPEHFAPFEAWLRRHKWELKAGNVVRAGTSTLVSGDALVPALSAPGGVVPSYGSDYHSAKEVVLLLSEMLSHEATWPAQKRHAMQWLAAGAARDEINTYNKLLGYELPKRMGMTAAFQLPMAALGPAGDLAMAVYHAFSVNAPAPALKALRASGAGNPAEFPERLIRALGTSPYGRWADTTDNRNRYDRTRHHVGNSELWPAAVVAKLMPVNL